MSEISRLQTSRTRDEAGPEAKKTPAAGAWRPAVEEVQPPRGPDGEEWRFAARPQWVGGAR